MDVGQIQNSSDWAAAKELLSGVQMTSTLPLVMARTGAIDASYPSLGGENILLTVRDGQKTVALMRGLLHRRCIDKKIQPLGYIGDLRVDKDWRGRALAATLGQAFREHIYRTEARQGYFLVATGNKILERTFGKVPDFKAEKATTHKTASFLLINKPRRPKRTEFQKLTPTLWSFKDYVSSLHSYFLGPAWAAEEFAAFYERYPEIRFYAHVDQPQRIAFALWDQRAIRTLFIGRYTAATRFIRIAWNILSRFTGAPVFPGSGKPWRQAEMCFVNPELIIGTDVDTFIRAEAWDMKCHFVHRIYEGLGQPLVSPKGLHYKSTAHLFTFGIDGHPPPQPAQGVPVFVDLALI